MGIACRLRDGCSAAGAVLKVLLVGEAALGAVMRLLTRREARAVRFSAHDARRRRRRVLGRVGFPYHESLSFLRRLGVAVTGPDEGWLAAAVGAVDRCAIAERFCATARAMRSVRTEQCLSALTPIVNGHKLFELAPLAIAFGLTHLRIEKGDFDLRRDALGRENSNGLCDRKHVDRDSRGRGEHQTEIDPEHVVYSIGIREEYPANKAVESMRGRGLVAGGS